jgi:hypothetical protein
LKAGRLRLVRCFRPRRKYESFQVDGEAGETADSPAALENSNPASLRF